MARIMLADAVVEYLAFRASRGDAANTIKNHGQVLRKAIAAWGGDTVLSNIGPRHISILYSQNDWGASTRNLYRSNLAGFFKWARSCRYMPRDSDPLEAWGNVRVPQVEKFRVPVARFPELLDAARHPRDRMVVALGLFTFSRGSEISAIQIKDVDLHGFEIRIYRQKTKQEDRIPISSELREELNRYLAWYRAKHGILQDDWFLVPAKERVPWEPGPSGKLVPPLSPAPLKPTVREGKPYRAVQRALRALGLPITGQGNHTLRRSGARALADHLRGEGYDGVLSRVGSMMGHESIKNTENYIGWQLDRTQRNEAIAGKPMFPELPFDTTAVVSPLRRLMGG